MIIAPEGCNTYYSTRDRDYPEQINGYYDIHKYTEDDFDMLLNISNKLLSMNFHNHNFNYMV